MAKDIDFYIRELMSTQCQCGKPKKPRHSFCWSCYKSLPKHMQHALYNYVLQGYEEAYDEAVQWLTE